MPRTKSVKLPPRIQRLLAAGRKLGNGEPKGKLSRVGGEEEYLHNLALADWEERQKLARLWLGVGLEEAGRLDPDFRGIKVSGVRDALDVGRLRANAKKVQGRGWKVGLPLSHRGVRQP